MIDRLDESVTDALAWLRRVERNGDGPRTDGGTAADAEAADASAGQRGATGENGRGASEGTGAWRTVDGPTSRALHGVVHGQDGAYAVGEGGMVLRRGTDGWRIVFERGPGVAKNTLRDVAATADGCRVWFAGDSGALGYFDVADGRKSDYSAPMEKTSTWEAIAVAGKTGEERVRIANGSGEVLDCTVEDGCPTWGEVVKPGGGSTINALTVGSGDFYAVDTSGGVYREAERQRGLGTASREADRLEASAERQRGLGTASGERERPASREGATDDGDSSTAPGGDNGSAIEDGPTPSEGGPSASADAADRWERIGVENAQVNFHDVWATGSTVFVAGGDGIAYRYDPECENWTPLYVGDGSLRAIRTRGAERIAAATGGRLYERDEGVRWDEPDVSTEASLAGLALARSGETVEAGLATTPVDVVVGESGAILEREHPSDGG
ncbi:hypothetical protein [Halovivax limisalsi]|uniref:hypothetical protein n=1 Tax=Halovivax limisalsi TaxID=1453760 RepID=UPI001FFD761E|nr:hypothetical protein [Halovivax limisalsi]